MTKIRFEPLTALTKDIIEDYKELINLITETGGAIGYLKSLSSAEARELLEPAIKTPSDVYILLAYHRNKIIGTGRLIRKKEHVQKHVADIDKSMVHPNYRRQHIGKKITENRIEEAKRRGIEIILAEVRSNNLPAINNLKKLGFREVGRLKNTVKIETTYFDTICFQLDLNKFDNF